MLDIPAENGNLRIRRCDIFVGFFITAPYFGYNFFPNFRTKPVFEGSQNLGIEERDNALTLHLVLRPHRWPEVAQRIRQRFEGAFRCPCRLEGCQGCPYLFNVARHDDPRGDGRACQPIFD